MLFKSVTVVHSLVSEAMSLGATDPLDDSDSLGNLNSYMSSARELLHRLDLLEQRQVRSYIDNVPVP